MQNLFVKKGPVMFCTLFLKKGNAVRVGTGFSQAHPGDAGKEASTVELSGRGSVRHRNS